MTEDESKHYRRCPTGTHFVKHEPCGFKEWYAELIQLATARNCRWMICKDSSREAWKDGLKPVEELEEQIDAAYRSQ